MPGKLTYRELEQRVKSLEKEVSNLRLCQDALMETEQQYRVILETVPDSITVTTLEEGRYLQVNKAFCDLSGYSREEVLGRTVFDLNLFLNRSDRQQIVDILKQTGAIDRLEVQYRQKDGNLFETIFSARSIRFRDQDCLLAVVTDITDLKKYNQQIQSSEQHFKDLAELLPAVVFEMDTEGYFTYINQRGFYQCQFTEDEFEKGINILDLVTPEDREKGFNLIQNSFSDDNTDLSVLQLKRKDGTSFPVASRSRVIEYHDRPVGLRGFFIDISSMKKEEVKKGLQMDHFKEVVFRQKGTITACMRCKRINDETGSWVTFSTYIQEHSPSTLIRSMCPECSRTGYPKYYKT